MNEPVMFNFAVTKVRGAGRVSGVVGCGNAPIGPIYSFDMVILQCVSFDPLKETGFY